MTTDDMTGDRTDDTIEVGPALKSGPSRAKRAGVIVAGIAGLGVACGGLAWATSAAGAAPSGAAYGYGQGYGQGHGPGGDGTRPTGAAPTGTPAPRTPHLVGTVKSASGSVILITDPDGFTRTIKVSSSTNYKDSLTATPAVGTKIAAEGAVDADGTSLDATTVEAPRQGGPGAGGPGRGGTAPSAKPTSTTTS